MKFFTSPIKISRNFVISKIRSRTRIFDSESDTFLILRYRDYRWQSSEEP